MGKPIEGHRSRPRGTMRRCARLGRWAVTSSRARAKEPTGRHEDRVSRSSRRSTFRRALPLTVRPYVDIGGAREAPAQSAPAPAQVTPDPGPQTITIQGAKY